MVTYAQSQTTTVTMNTQQGSLLTLIIQ